MPPNNSIEDKMADTSESSKFETYVREVWKRTHWQGYAAYADALREWHRRKDVRKKLGRPQTPPAATVELSEADYLLRLLAGGQAMTLAKSSRPKRSKHIVRGQSPENILVLLSISVAIWPECLQRSSKLSWFLFWHGYSMHRMVETHPTS
jgi:hypothetical protein